MMAGATPQKEKQQGIAAAPSAEDEALKRNTDCVYFLTSPLACKKGAGCEYRHSEYARVNPRDCYFWLNGNCLNPKCGFRHPPLDGLFDTEEEAPVGSFLPPLAPAIYAHQYPGKAPVQCIYFQKGFCSRGDKCGFLHEPNPAGSKISQQIVPAPSTEVPPTKPHTSHQQITQEIKTQQANLAKAADAPAEIKPVKKLETGLGRNGIDRNLPISRILHDEALTYKETILSPVVNGNPSRYNCMHQSLQVPDDHGILNGKDADEFLRESSPGFDVLVDDDRGEGQYGRTRGHERRNSINEYDIGHSLDYNSVDDMDRAYHDFDNYENIQGQYAWEQCPSPERILSGKPRGYSNVDSPQLSDDMDLRYRLLKPRRGNGLRSVVSHDFVSDKNVEDREYQGSSPRESAISGRFCGRIKLPRRSPNSSDIRFERERDRVRNQGILSSVRPRIPSHQGRFRDRIKSRVEGGDCNGNVHFSGPKSLAELKGTTSSEGRTQQFPRKRKHYNDNQQSEGDLSFKGPMPLSEILKRKRTSGTVMSSIEKQDNGQKELKENQAGSQGGISSMAPAVENENEGDDQREGEEYVYEQGDEGEYYEDGENAEAEVDDDDDFAKKIGVIFS